MNKCTGIDISKATFDAAFYQAEDRLTHRVFANDAGGFEELLTYLKAGDQVVMEASGTYYLRLACFLHEHDVRVSVVNPLVIRRFSQMQLMRAKTDRKDAAVIAAYGVLHNPPLWQPEAHAITRMKQINTALELMNRQITAITNQLEALMQCVVIDPHTSGSLEKCLAFLEAESQQLEQQLQALVQEHYADTYQALTTIPGIGPKTAILLIAITGNFTRFDHYKQLLSYVGLSPRIFQSGTSVRGRTRICKMGMGNIRKLLYMCSWSAKRSNVFCSEMYHRLKAQGKPERLIKVAIANKLLRQAFAVGKTLQPFDENYRVKLG